MHVSESTCTFLCIFPAGAGVLAVLSFIRVCAGPLDEGFSTQADFDRFLGELIFSQSDVRDDVLKSLDKAGDDK